MSLTNDDLQAIKGVVTETVQPMIDELALQTAAGFNEVHTRIDGVESRLGGVETRLGGQIDSLETTTNRIENKLDATIDRVDDHEVRLQKLKPRSA